MRRWSSSERVFRRPDERHYNGPDHANIRLASGVGASSKWRMPPVLFLALVAEKQIVDLRIGPFVPQEMLRARTYGTLRSNATRPSAISNDRGPCEPHELHPNRITRWKRQAIERVAKVFDDKALEIQARRVPSQISARQPPPPRQPQ